MWQVRPLGAGDLAAVEMLLQNNALRLSTLPADRDHLAANIDAARRGFEGKDALASLLFGLHDGDGKLHGICGIQPYAGGDERFYSYRIDELVHASRRLGINQRQKVLYLSHELTGLTSLCSFALSAQRRATPVFHLLFRSRLLYIASHRHAFADELICEVQGIWDDSGQSLFWKSVGELFFGLDFITADEQCALLGKTVIAELLPPYPIYNTLLPEQVQSVIARPHPGTTSTTAWLHSEGMHKTRFVDPFDAGPTYRGELALLKSMQAIRIVDSVQTASPDPDEDGDWLVSQGEGVDFRCVMLRGRLQDGIVLCADKNSGLSDMPGLALPLELPQ